MKKHRFFLFPILWTAVAIFYPAWIPSHAPLHQRIVLRGFDGSPLSVESKEPYSPRKTCGACHDYDRTTNGYHFQQGRTDGTGKIVVSDAYDPKFPWNLSSGMYGKHSLACGEATALAKKVNTGPSEIDQSSFSFVRNCGLCHPGGGLGEYDRKGNLYYDGEKKRFGYELSGDDPKLDGDYTPIRMGNVEYGAPWDRSGPSEADCLICHLKGYLWKERGAALREGLFQYGPTVGAGWARMNASSRDQESQAVKAVEIDYSRKEVADFENLHLQITKRPSDENCWTCHAVSDRRKRGRQWSRETDIHKSKGLGCISCHPTDQAHNFAKGDSIEQTVRDDLDLTMNSCEDCHYKGKDKKAPRYKHPFSPKHMRRIACQTCHIPFQSAPADLVYDLSTGTAEAYETSKFLTSDPIDPRKKMADTSTWFPTIREFKGKIVPAKSLVVIYFGDLDKKTNVVKPVPLWKIKELKKPTLKPDLRHFLKKNNSTLYNFMSFYG